MSEDSFRGELSFVDLALVLVKRRWVLLGALVVFSGLSFFYVASKEPVYEYESLYQLPFAERGKGQLFNAERVANDIEYSKWPEAQKSFTETHSRGVPFRLNITSDTDLDVVSVKSRASLSNREFVENIHATMLKKLAEDLSGRLGSYREELQEQLEATQATIEELSAREQPGNELGRAYQNQFRLEDLLASMEPGYIVAVASQSEQPVSTSKTMLLIALVVMSVFAALILAFFVEFVTVVKRAMHVTKEAAAR